MSHAENESVKQQANSELQLEMRRARRISSPLDAWLCCLCMYLSVVDGFLTLQETPSSLSFCQRLQRFDTSKDVTFQKSTLALSTLFLSSSSSETELFPERLNIIYDAKCSVCRWEVDHLTYLMSKLPGAEENPKLIRFTDLESDDGYDESDPVNGGVTYVDGMRSFRAVRPDGSTIKGIDVFKEAYSIVQFGWLWQWTNTPWLRSIADWGYKLFASIRTNVTRGSNVEDLINQHYDKSGSDECEQCKQKFSK